MSEHIKIIADQIILPENDLSDFIYNRFDQQGKQNFGTVSCSYDREYDIPFYLENDTVHLGLWLGSVPETVLGDVTTFLFQHFPRVKYIQFQNHLIAFKKSCDVTASNHWRVPLPTDAEALRLTLTSKARYNLKREKRIAREELGEYRIVEYDSSNVPDEVIEQYFRFKSASYDTPYKLSPKEYLKEYFVSNIYVLQFENEIGAILLSCEQKKNVYLENLTYNPAYRKYSLGKALYDDFLEILITKGMKNVYLGGGNQEYKSHYGSVEEKVYSGTVYRSSAEFFRKVKLPQKTAYIKRKFFRFGHKVKMALNIKARVRRGAIRLKRRLGSIAYALGHKSWKTELKQYRDRKKLMICAHPDDESLFFYETLKTDPDILVICLSHASDRERSQEFQNAMRAYHTNGVILDLPDSDEIWYRWGGKSLDRLMRKIKRIVEPDVVYTHNPEGEYGHTHHKAVSGAVARNFKGKIYVPQRKHVRQCSDLSAKVKLLSDCYPSQDLAGWHPEYVTYEGTEEWQ